ncbi:MAG: hypothetical protein ACP5SH_10375 [Syntrophobacteraceae bacterium]
MLIKKICTVCLVFLLGAACSPVFAAPPIMVEKNLFSEDRKPPSQNGSSVSQSPRAEMAIGDIQLDGVVFRNNSRSALLRLKNVPMGMPGDKGLPASPFVTVHVGEIVNDFRVTKIQIQRVTLERNGQSYSLGLFSSNKVVAPASPAPPAAAAYPHGGSVSAPAQGVPSPHPAAPGGAAFPKGFHPPLPPQALGGRMPSPPTRGAPRFVPPPPGAVGNPPVN